jgi:membrane protein YdbS with pleckstrin-like domain
MNQPIKFNFPGKEDDEKVYLYVRRHYFVLIKQSIIFLFFFTFPVIIIGVLMYFNISIKEYNFYPIIILIMSLYYLFVILFAMIKWIEYYYDIWIITDKRLVDIEQKSLFNHVTSELRLDKIQDITFEMKGFLASLFHYGNIYVQTAGSVQRFSLEQVPKSQEIKGLIIELQGQMENNKKDEV